jgi:hypothetical protein
MGKPAKTNSDGAARQRYLQKAAELMSGKLPVLAARYADCVRELSKKTQVIEISANGFVEKSLTDKLKKIRKISKNCLLLSIYFLNN